MGVLINNVPVRARLDEAQRADTWLAAMQARHADLRSAEHVPLETIQRWSGLPWGQRLFESLVVFQDAAAEAGLSGWFGPTLRCAATVTPTETAYPVTLLVTGDAALTVTLRVDARWLGAAQAAELARQLRAALGVLTATADSTVGALLARLPTPQWTPATALAARGPRIAPRDPLELVLARQWATVLGHDEVGVTESLFALGGSSLAATQLVARARERFQSDVTVRALFEAPTVEGFARTLVARERTGGLVQRIAQLILKVERMSADEVRAATAQSAAPSDRGVPT